MASTMNDALAALAAISNIINRETETLKTKAVVEDSTQSKPDSIIDAIRMGMIENNIMVEVNKRFDLLEAKLSAVPPQPVVDLTKVFAALEGIEERLKKLETVPVAAPAPAPAPAPVQVDPDLITKVKAISASFDAAINKIEAKVNLIEASISEEEAKEKEEEVAEKEEETKEEEEEVAEEESAEEEEVAEEEEAEAEEEEVELTEFRYKGKDYYMDAECNVYEADEEGNPTLVGVYNEVTRKITFNN